MAATPPKKIMSKLAYNVFALPIAESLQEPMFDFRGDYVASLLIAVCDSVTGPSEVANVVGPDVGFHTWQNGS